MSRVHSLSSFVSFWIFLASLYILKTDAVGVKFITPAPGATLPPSHFAVNWTDAGGAPPGISQLTTYNLTLVVGGILQNNSKSLVNLSPPDALVSSLGIVVDIPADVGQSIQNGFYLCMTSNTNDGNQVINYSDRFTLIELTGTTDAQYVQGAASTVGDSNVPSAQVNNYQPQPALPSSSLTVSSTTTNTSPGATSVTTQIPVAQTDYSIGQGQLAGLLVGTFCAIILFLVLIVLGLIWWRRKRKAKREQDNDTKDEAVWSGKIELPGDDKPSVRAVPLVELSPDQERYEVMTPVETVEADSDIRYELEGDWSGWEAAARRSQAYDPTR